MLMICGGLMRTGSVAMFQIMREIVESSHLGYVPSMPHNREAETFDENVERWASGHAIVVTKLHRWRESMDPFIAGVKAVVTIRDMRDVTVSLMNFRKGTFDSSLHSAAFKGNVEGQAEWEVKLDPEDLKIVKYEKFMLGRVAMTMSVANFMGLHLKPIEAVKIERKWSLKANIARAQRRHPAGHPEFMSERHIHSGKVGQWREVLTEEQILEVQERAGYDWFKSNGYPLYESLQV